MSVHTPGELWRNTLLGGLRVDKGAATLPASTTGALFTVAGGRVAITAIVGEVTTIVQNQACNAKLVSTPTVGTAVDLCAVLNIQAKEAGTLFGITGIFGDAMVGANAGAGILPQRMVVVPPGTIGLNTSATNTGATKWTVFYVPIDDGATVVAA
jgi:hypothetical protein